MLWRYLKVGRTPGRRERTSFFLRAESFYHVASPSQLWSAFAVTLFVIGGIGGIVTLIRWLT